MHLAGEQRSFGQRPVPLQLILHDSTVLLETRAGDTHVSVENSADSVLVSYVEV